MKSGREVMKGEMEENWKIAGAGIAVMAVVLALAAITPMVSARVGPTLIQRGDTAFIGEQGVTFDLNGNGVADAGDVGTLEGVPDTPTEGASPISVSVGMTIPETTEGKYYADTDGVPGWSAGDFYVFIDHAEIAGDIILNNPEQDSIVDKSVPTTAEIIFKIETNIGTQIPGACVDIEISPEPPGKQIDGHLLDDIPIVGTTMFVADMTGVPPGVLTRVPTTNPPSPQQYGDALDLGGLDTGEYTVRFVLDKTTCNMLDVSSPEYKFTIRAEVISIEAVEDVVTVGEDIELTIEGDPEEWYYLTVTHVDPNAPPAIILAEEVEDVSPDGLAAWILTDSDGTATVRIDTTGADDRTYKIKVYDPDAAIAAGVLAAPAPPAFTYAADDDVDDATPEEDEDSVDVKVEEAEVWFDVPRSAMVGETITIRGGISAGDYVDIVIEEAGVVFDDEPVDENNEFEVDWDTSGLTTGSYIIEVYIDRADALGTEVPLGANGVLDPSDYEGIDEDGKTSIRLVMPELTAEQERNLIAEGDDYTIKGTATGVEDVDIVLIGPNGYPTTMPPLDVSNGLDIISASVTEDEFSEDITMGGPGFDTGIWKAVVLHPGRDGVYGDIAGAPGAGEFTLDIDGNGRLDEVAGKNQEQIVDIILDHTINVAGSDDMAIVLDFKVESGWVELPDVVLTAAVGEPLIINGTTNREPGTLITISTFSGPADLPAEIVEVEWPTPDIGVFNVTIETSDAVPGTYILEADDGEGHTDTVTVEIKAAVPSPTPSPTPTVSPTPTPTPSPTPTPTISPVVTPTPTPTPTPSPTPPGFEALFAVAGLLAIAYFVLRRRK